MLKKTLRFNRAAKTRHRIKVLDAYRLTVYRTPNHIYAQILGEGGSKVLACANTLQKDIKTSLPYTGNIDAAKVVGKTIAEKALSVGINNVAFDRSGYKFHGRVKALADAAREAGLSF